MALKVMPVVEGIYQVKLPLPFALNSVNCYLIREHRGWTVVDCGINTEAARNTWLATLQAMNIRPREIRHIVLTHVHPDHFGLAGWLSQLVQSDGGRVRVYLSEREHRQVRMIWQQETKVIFRDWLIQLGMPVAMADSATHGMDNTRDMTLPHPTQYTYLPANSTLKIGERTFKALLAPGHSDGQLMFYSAEDGVMLSGDHILMKITPNIGLWTDTDPHPLQRFMASLREFSGMPVRIGLPGHKAIILDWAERIEQLISHHNDRLYKAMEGIDSGLHTPFEISQYIFQSFRFSPHEWRFALAEAYAHLDYLEQLGKVKKEASDPVYYKMV
jgi:glyoxylase-like metal-dependent hydrolase (beta-lactamase superfamily II)